MAIPVLIIGKSGSGKSSSLRNCLEGFNLIKVLDKPLPFKGKIPNGVSDDYAVVLKWLAGSKEKSIVIDDCGYLITSQFMNNHSSQSKGNAIYGFYNDLAGHFWTLIHSILKLPSNKIVYIIMQEEINDHGEIKPKTIGKLLDEKVCLEGLFTIVLRCVGTAGSYKFITQSENGAVSKSPIGMFDTVEIDNDLQFVDKSIREYYEIGEDVE